MDLLVRVKLLQSNRQTSHNNIEKRGSNEKENFTMGIPAGRNRDRRLRPPAREGKASILIAMRGVALQQAYEAETELEHSERGFQHKSNDGVFQNGSACEIEVGK